ncbi:cupin domain-containing protein [Arthrobacter alkaliphilus]
MADLEDPGSHSPCEQTMTVNLVTQLEVKSHNSPDEVRRPEKTVVENVTVGDYTIGRLTFEPGWSWADCIKPLAQTESCQLNHVGYCVAGTLEVETTDGNKISISKGDSYTIPPGHNAWVVGDETYSAIEFVSAAEFGVKRD